MTSSMVGPGVTRLGPLRATDPMEVVTVSIYVIPMASSCTMQLAHIMATVGLIVTSSCRGSGGASLAVTGNGSLCSRLHFPEAWR